MILAAALHVPRLSSNVEQFHRSENQNQRIRNYTILKPILNDICAERIKFFYSLSNIAKYIQINHLMFALSGILSFTTVLLRIFGSIHTDRKRKFFFDVLFFLRSFSLSLLILLNVNGPTDAAKTKLYYT